MAAMPSVGRIKQLSVVGVAAAFLGVRRAPLPRERCLAVGVPRPRRRSRCHELEQPGCPGDAGELRRSRPARPARRRRHAHARARRGDGSRLVLQPRRRARLVQAAASSTGSTTALGARPALRSSRTSTGELRRRPDERAARRDEKTFTPTASGHRTLGDYVRFGLELRDTARLQPAAASADASAVGLQVLDDDGADASARVGGSSPVDRPTLRARRPGDRRRRRPRARATSRRRSVAAAFGTPRAARRLPRPHARRRRVDRRSTPTARGSSARLSSTLDDRRDVADGDHTMTVTVTDWAGNTRSDRRQRTSRGPQHVDLGKSTQTLSIGTSGIDDAEPANPTPAAPAASPAARRSLPLAAPVGLPGPEAAADLQAACRSCRRQALPLQRPPDLRHRRQAPVGAEADAHRHPEQDRQEDRREGRHDGP